MDIQILTGVVVGGNLIYASILTYYYFLTRKLSKCCVTLERDNKILRQRELTSRSKYELLAFYYGSEHEAQILTEDSASE